MEERIESDGVASGDMSHLHEEATSPLHVEERMTGWSPPPIRSHCSSLQLQNKSAPAVVNQ